MDKQANVEFGPEQTDSYVFKTALNPPAKVQKDKQSRVSIKFHAFMRGQAPQPWITACHGYSPRHHCPKSLLSTMHPCPHQHKHLDFATQLCNEIVGHHFLSRKTTGPINTPFLHFSPNTKLRCHHYPQIVMSDSSRQLVKDNDPDLNSNRKGASDRACMCLQIADIVDERNESSQAQQHTCNFST